MCAVSMLAVSCDNGQELEMMNNEGYLRLEVNTLTSTNTRTDKPDGYKPKTLSIQITDNNSGKVVMATNDVANDEAFKGNIVLPQGTYTINGSSAGWDGSGSGFGAPYYEGFTRVTVKAKTLTKATLTLTQANVKVSVKFDENFRKYFREASCIVSSAVEGVAMRRFGYQTVGSAYFPVGNLNFLLAVTNMAGDEHSMSKDVTGVKARDHYIINYKIAEAGNMGGVSVSVDDATQSYTFNIEVPRKSSTALQVMTANAWSTFADLTGSVTAKTAEFDETKLTMQYRLKSAPGWTEIPYSQLVSDGADGYTYRLNGLTPGKIYVYRMGYNNGETRVNSNEMEFTTETQLGIENSSFENWYKSGASWFPDVQDGNYWSCSNPGSTTMGDSYNVTTRSTEMVHSGTYSAKLATKYVVIKLAAASMFTGQFAGLIGTNGAKLNWGVPFASRPSALKGYMSFTPGTINRGSQPSGVDAPAKGEMDACQIFCALLTEQLKVGGNVEEGEYKKSTLINWEEDPRVIAYGEMTRNTGSNGQWEEFTIPLKYHVQNRKPAYMLIVCSANKWGDYFYGCDSNVLYLDDFSFEYGEPTLQ